MRGQTRPTEALRPSYNVRLILNGHLVLRTKPSELMVKLPSAGRGAKERSLLPSVSEDEWEVKERWITEACEGLDHP